MKTRWLWQLAERMDWNDARPRWLWRSILKWQDRRNGYHFNYEE